MEAIGLDPSMTKDATCQPPRLLPDRPFPPDAYVPGHTPHPTRDPAGHHYGAEFEIPEPPDPEEWHACRDYLYGIDLFNHGFYWEAHEAWEGLWVACGRCGPTATYLQALINLAAAGFKARSGSARGMRANADKAARLFKSVASDLGPIGHATWGSISVCSQATQALSRNQSRPARQRRATRTCWFSILCCGRIRCSQSSVFITGIAE